MLEAGTKAPVFSLPDKDGNMISLENYRGKRVVLYFTPGTTRRAAPGRPAPSREPTRALSRRTWW